jgi:hypothetical protein
MVYGGATLDQSKSAPARYWASHLPGDMGRQVPFGLVERNGGISRGVTNPDIWGDPRWKRIGIAALVVGCLLALGSGATGMAAADGNLRSDGAALFTIIFGFIVAVGLIAFGVYVWSHCLEWARSHPSE